MTDAPIAAQGLATQLPGALYLTGEDALKLTVYNAAAGVTVTLSGRTLAFGATRPSPFVQTLTPTTDRAASSVIVGMPDGWLLNAQVIVSGGSPLLGQAFARLTLVRGLQSSAQELCPIARGYITAKQAIGFPLLGDLDTLAGAGALRSITGTQPAAGAEISEAVPTGARWALVALEVDLTTNGNAANRVPQLTLDDGTTVYARTSVNVNQTASLTWRNSFQAGGSQISDATRAVVRTPIGDALMLGAGHRLRTVTANIDAGDQYAAPQLLVREWIEGA